MARTGQSVPIIDVVIPALNEEKSIGRVLTDLPDGWVRRVVVVDNGSEDATAAVARAHGAEVVAEPRRGYGTACLTGLDHLAAVPPEIVVFIDGDYSDFPEELPDLVRPIIEDDVELVIGSRTRGERSKGALLPQAIFGNWLSCLLIRQIWGARFTDLGPFRAITWPALVRLAMADPDFGWTVEMQVKAARRRVRFAEIPVKYRPRIGVSKVTGTVRGSFLAGTKILYTIFVEALED